MIEEGDRIMVCLSGGKDSYTMLEILRNLQKSAPISFSLVAVNLDQKQPVPGAYSAGVSGAAGVEYKIVEENTYGIVKEKIPEGKPPARCALACVAASSIVPPPSSGRPRSPSAIIATISCRRCF